jgi:phosphoglycolate phosphatase-like HAD superfamily hydrolase
MIWAFDVDGTLIGAIRSDLLRPGTVELLSALEERQVECVLWSAGGGAYAERKAVDHGIAGWFSAFYAKAARDGRGRYLVDHLPPEHRPDVFVDDSPIDLPHDAHILHVPSFLGGGADRGLIDLLERIDGVLDELVRG